MIALALQLTFAGIASFRGRGFAPWGLLLILVAFSFITGAVFGASQGLFYFLITVDWVAVALLGYMAFVPKE